MEEFQVVIENVADQMVEYQAAARCLSNSCLICSCHFQHLVFKHDMDETNSSQRQKPNKTGLARSKEGALGRFWGNFDAGLILELDKNPTDATTHEGVSQRPDNEIQHVESPHQFPSSATPSEQRQTYGRRVLPPRESVASPTTPRESVATPTTPRTPTPSSPHPQPTDYIPRLIPYPDCVRVFPTTSQNRDPRLPHMEHDAFPLDDDSLMLNISPLFRSSSNPLRSQPDGYQCGAADMPDVSPRRPAPRGSSDVSRPSVDRPSPRSQPYPRYSPYRQNVRVETSGGTSSRMTGEDHRKVLIEPRIPNRFVPANHGIDIGLHCMGKHWVAGWTTVEYIPQWAKDQWFEEFQLLATWDAKHTPTIKGIFFEKCRNKLNDGWYNMRHARCKEGLRFLKRHEVDAGLVWYAQNADKIDKISERNKQNSKDIAARIHRGGPKGTDVHYMELEAELGEGKVYCRDMWEKLKMKPGGTYVSDAAAEKAVLLEKAHDNLKVKYGDSVPQALDFEVGADILGYNKRTKLPKAMGTAATMVEGSKFNRIASLHIGGSSRAPSSQLDDVAQELTQLKQSHQQMMEFQIKQQEVIIKLTQALLKANSSQPEPVRQPQPQCPNQDDDSESSV